MAGGKRTANINVEVPLPLLYRLNMMKARVGAKSWLHFLEILIDRGMMPDEKTCPACGFGLKLEYDDDGDRSRVIGRWCPKCGFAEGDVPPIPGTGAEDE